MFKTIFKALKPFQLLSLMTTYLMGAGLVKYLRGFSGWLILIQGGFFLIFIVLSLELLCLLFSLHEPRNWPTEMRMQKLRLTRIITAALSATLLVLATNILLNWIALKIVTQGLLFLLIALITLSGMYYLAQFIKILLPFALLIEVMLFVVLPPAFAFFLHAEDLHPYLTMVVISLVPAYLANRFLHLLENFGHDLKYSNETTVTYIGWEKAIFLHNALILLTYLLLALIAAIGVHWFIVWPVFLTLPIGMLEIWLMERVKRGMKPLWRVMRYATACVLLIPVYLIGFSFWVN